MNSTFFDFSGKTFQINLGFGLLVIWKTYRWRVALHVGHRRFSI